MSRSKKALGSIFGVALSLIMSGTQVYAAGNADYSDLSADEQIVSETVAETDVDAEPDNVVFFDESEPSEEGLEVPEEVFEEVSEEVSEELSEDADPLDDIVASEELTEITTSEENLYYSDPLPAAEDAKWTSAGWIEFTMPMTGVYYSIALNGPNMVMQDFMGISCQEPGQKMTFNVSRFFNDEGIYSFCIQTTEQPQNYSFGGVSSTGFIDLEYVRPSTCYSTPTNLRWVKNEVARWDAADGELYLVTFYKDGELITTSVVSDKQWEDKWNMLGEGDWTFTVRAFGNSPDEIASSAVSEMSPVYTYGTELPEDPEDTLPLATDLHWENGKAVFMSNASDVYYSIEVYGPDNSPINTGNGLTCSSGEYISYPCEAEMVESGMYKFRVKTTTERDDYNFSTGAVTDWCQRPYTRPETTYETPARLWWTNDGVAHWDAVSGSPYYYVKLFDGINTYARSIRLIVNGTSCDGLKDFLTEEGNWTFTVRAYGENPDQIGSSEESEKSPVYDPATAQDSVELPKATNLYWESAGRLAFTSTDSDAYYSVEISGPSGRSIYYGNKRNEGEEIRFFVSNMFTESGIYKFRVKTTDNEHDNNFSSGAVTEWCSIEYVKPVQTYSAPTELWWTKDGSAHWNATANNVYYRLQLYKNGSQSVSFNIFNDTVRKNLNNYLSQEGEWTFRVYTYGTDPEVTGASELSVSSPVFDPNTALDPVVIDLSPATNLQWKQGSACFTSNSSEAYYSLQLVYSDGRSPYYITGVSKEAGNEVSFFLSPEFLTEGTYKFRVKTTDGKNDTDFTKGVVTEWCEKPYTKPANTLQTPTNLWWTKDGTAHWEEKNKGFSYICTLYKNSKLYARYQYCFGKDSYTWTGIDLDSAEWTFTVQAYCNDPDQFAASEESALSPVFDINTARDPQEKPDLNGLADGGDGNWYLYDHGRVVADYNGFYDGGSLGWWLVLNGRVAFEYNDFYKDPDGNYWLVKGGQIAFDYTGDYESTVYGGKWHVENGRMTGPAEDEPDVDKKNGLAEGEGGNWYLYKDGKVVENYNGFYDGGDLGWWLVLEGRVAFEYNDFYQASDGSYWLVKGGSIDFGYTGDFESTVYGGKWHVENGQLTGPVQEEPDEPDAPKKNGLAEGEGGNWYLYDNDNVVESYNGFYDGGSLGWWLVLNGRVAFEYNDFYEAEDHSWWLVKGGAIDFGYNGIYESAIYGGKWNVQNGQLMGPVQEESDEPGEPDDPHTTGFAEGENGVWYLYENGQIASDFSGLYNDSVFGWWLVLDGRVAFEYNDIYGDDHYGWWKVSGGQVDFGFSDLYESQKYGWWLITGGTVDFGYSDIYNSPSYGFWLVEGGQVNFGFNGVYNSQIFSATFYVENGAAHRQ